MDPSNELSCSFVNNTNELDFTVDNELDVTADCPSLSSIDSPNISQPKVEVDLIDNEQGEDVVTTEKVIADVNKEDDEENTKKSENEFDEESKEKVAVNIMDANVNDDRGDTIVGNAESNYDTIAHVDEKHGEVKGDTMADDRDKEKEDSGGKPSEGIVNSEFKINRIKKCRVKLPMKGEKFRVKFVDNCNVPHKLHLKNTDKVEKRKLNMLLAKKLLEPLTSMPMARLKEKSHVLVKFKKPAKLIRAQVKWIQSEAKIEVQDMDSGALCLVTKQDIFVLDSEQIANIYPRLFVCTLSEFDGKDIFWNPLIRDLYISTLRCGQLSIEIRTLHHTVQTHDVLIKLLLDDKKFINVNEWLGNSLIPYLVYLKTSSTSQLQVAKCPAEIFFPYVKLLKE